MFAASHPCELSLHLCLARKPVPFTMPSIYLGACLALAFSLVGAVDLTFFSSDRCDKGAIYGGQVNSTTPCYRLDKHLDIPLGNSTSVDNLIAGQTAVFYSDSDCEH